MAAPAIVSPVELPATPFRGIHPFRYVDRNIFFARRLETEKLVRIVTLYRGVLLYGASGSGKSSLINAGLIRAADKEGFSAERLRVQPRSGEEIIVERIPRTHDGKPPYLPSLFSTDDDDRARVVLSTVAFKRRLESLKSKPGRLPLLIFDQFEEFVTLFEETPNQELDKSAVQNTILELLVDLLRDHKLPIKLVFAFKEDHFARLNKLFVLCPNLTDQYLRLTPPRTEALEEIIHGPFDKFPARYGTKFSPALSSKLASTFKEHSKDGTIVLSDVQLACLELWNSDDPEALFQELGVEGLLDRYLTGAINGLPKNLQDPALALLSNMITDSGAPNVLAQEDLISLVMYREKIPEEKAKAALDALVDGTKLVQREQRRNTLFYQLVSESLLPRIHEQKAARASHYEHRKKVISWAVCAFLFLFSVAVALTAWYVNKKRTEAAIAKAFVVEANQKTEAAEKRAGEAEAQSIAANEARVQADAHKAQAERDKAQLDADLTKLTADYDSLKKDRNLLKDNSLKQIDDLRYNLAVERFKNQGGLKQLSTLDSELVRFKSEIIENIGNARSTITRKEAEERMARLEAQIKKLKEILSKNNLPFDF